MEKQEKAKAAYLEAEIQGSPTSTWATSYLPTPSAGLLAQSRGLACFDGPLSSRLRATQPQMVAGIPYDQLDASHELVLIDKMARIPSVASIVIAGAPNVGRQVLVFAYPPPRPRPTP
ncbi:hypothetical protein PG984_013831 [Apiospora sp. TS-2023a]